MPMKMGIHYKLIGHRHSAFLDSRIRRNDGGMFFPRNASVVALCKSEQDDDIWVNSALSSPLPPIPASIKQAALLIEGTIFLFGAALRAAPNKKIVPGLSNANHASG